MFAPQKAKSLTLLEWTKSLTGVPAKTSLKCKPSLSLSVWAEYSFKTSLISHTPSHRSHVKTHLSYSDPNRSQCKKHSKLHSSRHQPSDQSIIHQPPQSSSPLMSLPIRYPPMASYFRLSIIFLTLQILQHPPCRRNLLRSSCKPLCDHHRLYPIPITPLVQYHIGDLPHDLWTTLLSFSFLSLFSFIWCILLRPNQSQVIAPCSWDLTICFSAHKSCAHFTYHLYLRLLYLLQKRRKFSPELRLKLVPSHRFALLHLCTFALSHTPNTLRFIALYQTSISHHFALLDTMSGDHFTAPESHPSELHRIYT